MAISTSFVNIIGDCSNTSQGSISFGVVGTSPPFSAGFSGIHSGITFSSYILGDTTFFSATGLSSTTYSIYVSDTSFPSIENLRVAPIFIPSGTTISIDLVLNTTCGLNNGALTATTRTNYNYNNIELYKDNVLYTSGITYNNTQSFYGLESGVYYAKCIDIGGCESYSNSVIIGNSPDLDFGYYVVNNPSCLPINNGSIIITGTTGSPPFTYTWYGLTSGTPFTGTTATGLTPGSYSVKVTDSYGCSVEKAMLVDVSPKLSFVTYSVVNPTCLSSNGSITFTFSGGSAPYYYQLSNGENQVILSNTVTFTGLSSGNYSIVATDAGFCTASASAFLTTPQTFTVLTSSVQDASCSVGGSINLNLTGGVPPYRYTITNSLGESVSQVTSLSSVNFSNLIPETYTLVVEDTLSACTYTDTLVVGDDRHFTFSITGNTSTCGNSNGSINIAIDSTTISGLEFSYSISSGQQSYNSIASAYTFYNLSTGFYEVTVSDNLGCTQTKNIFIPTTNPYNLTLIPTSCFDGNSGTITALIESTEGPFDLVWSDNVNGQSGIYVTGLTAGTYSLIVSGSNGCVNSEVTTITCSPTTYTSYSLKYSTGDKTFTPATNINLTNMMYQGFKTLTENSKHCILESAKFYFKIVLGDDVYLFPFYYTTSFDNIPDLDFFSDILKSSVLSIPDIETCDIDPKTNQLVITSKLVSGVEVYAGKVVTFTVIIDFEINCNSVNGSICY
jgi:hypothetical protein